MQGKTAACGLWLVATMMSAPALAQTTAERHAMGQLADGTAIEGVTLSNDRGIRATIITYGATLQAFEANDRDGNFADITLGFDTAAEYEAFPNYFGVTVGRFANRIAGAPPLEQRCHILPSRSRQPGVRRSPTAPRPA